MHIPEMVNQLSSCDIKLYLAGGTLRATKPAGYATWADVSPATRSLLERLRENKDAVMQYLRALELARTPQGQQLKVYPMRQACIEADCCRQFTTESDCELYPIMDWEQGEPTGWCRERI
ncbi:hypothetical protein [Desulfurispora thermophila]|uniref:hypothetical protein n=1 Tax=Desulfurispora thermophila TaxID=265470 RepID=UPI0003743E2E|nr:hypothetical protein [Desulfurispora thermophila]